MLSPNQMELLTGHVDGELTHSQAQELVKLLESSEEARAFLAKLQADSRRIRDLPQLSAPEKLAPIIRAEISRREQSLKFPRAIPRHPNRGPVVAWTMMAAAAAVLLLIGAVSFWVNHSEPSKGLPGLAKVGKGANRKGTDLPNPDKRAEDLLPENAIVGNQPLPRTTTPEESGPDAGKVGPGGTSSPAIQNPGPKPLETPRPDPDQEAVMAASGGSSNVRLEKVEAVIPTLFSSESKVESATIRQSLTDLLTKTSAVRIDVVASDSARLAEMLLKEVQDKQTRLVVDSFSINKLKKPATSRGDYLLWLDDPSLDRVTSLANKALTAFKDSKESPGNSHLVLSPLGRMERKEFQDFLSSGPGTEPGTKSTPSVGAPTVHGFFSVYPVPRPRTSDLKQFLLEKQKREPAKNQVLIFIRQQGS